MMIIGELISYLDGLLFVNDFTDRSYNGLQVAGREDINKIVFGVTICQELIDKAIEANADAILVHHGLFWQGDDPYITGIKQQRIKALLENDINLLAYHLPLDFHAELGNNVQFAKELDISIEAQNSYLYFGTLSQPLAADEFAEFLRVHLHYFPTVILANNEKVERVAWCVGKGYDFLDLAKAQGVDAYITGEISEPSVYQARELGINLFAAGHYATERYGVIALAQHLTSQWQFETEFVEIINPI